MGCTKCGTDLSSLHLIVKDIIRQLIDEGKLQEGLVDCTDKRLWRDSRVLTCDLLGDAVCQLITNGDICLVKPEALTVEKQENGSHKISLLMSDGTVLDTTARLADGVLNSVTYDAKTKIAKFTTTNGDSYEIKLDIPEPVEYTFTTKENGDIEVANGKKDVLATIPAIKVKAVKEADGDVVITNQDGTTVEVPAIKVKAAKEADGKVVITNQDGTTVEIEKPAEFDLSKHVDNKTVRLKDGKLEVIKEKCATVTNLNTLEASDGNLKQLGISCFTGMFSAADANTAIGAPVKFGETNVEKSDAITAKEDITSGYQLDFTGWQVATGSEVHQYIYSRVGAENVQSGWVRSNDSGMNADGTLKNPNDWGKWVYELNLPEQPAPAAGLDCAAIDTLPERPWKKGTVLLAKQDGECVRLTAFDSIFQEVGVGITADKTNGLVSDNYKVVVTVSNTGEGKNELTNLNIVGPANTTDYEIKDVSFTKSEADEVEQVDNLTYNIRGLKKGGTVKVKYTVVPKVKGTYQFTAAVNPNSALDKDLGNNNATIILRSDTASKAITGENCPAIETREKESSALLTQISGIQNPITGIVQIPLEYRDISRLEYPNIFQNRTTLKGLVLTCNTDVTAVVRGLNADGTNEYGQRLGTGTGFGTDDGSVYSELLPDIGTAQTAYAQLNPNATHVRTTNSINIVGNEITITEDVTELVLLVRPRGANCYWQAYLLFCNTAPKTESIKVTNVVGGVLTTVRTPKVKLNGTYKVNSTTSGVTEFSSISGGYVEKQVVTVKKGTAATASVDFGKFNKFYSSGLVEITANSLTVSANATPSDSIRSTYLDVIIEE
jgi:hypothetical protein